MPDQDTTHGHIVGQVDPDDDDNTPTVRTSAAASALDEDDHHVRASERARRARGR